ncbi:MAG: diguanylate cyclase [Lachnospiraceae bacterium]|nr:diguanylate cyclase [Lachnospiraceae bacterium]
MEEKKKHSLLIVDDEKTYLMELTKILSPEYEIYAAKNGADAIQTALELSPDVILLDIVLPDMDGYEVIYYLKSDERTHDIPVIFVSGLTEVDDEERGLHLGAADYITKPFSPGIVKLRVLNQINMVEQLRRIEQLSMTDQLTGLPNRRSFDERLNAEWRQASREKKPISILIIDVDEFKNYNDTFGHQQGDRALQALALAFDKAPKRPVDFVARWGGEEFIVLLPLTDYDGSLEVAEQIRRNIEELVIPGSSGPESKITVSIGLNTWRPGDEFTLDKFISGADTALYNAKDKGRNKIWHFI